LDRVAFRLEDVVVGGFRDNGDFPRALRCAVLLDCLLVFMIFRLEWPSPFVSQQFFELDVVVPTLRPLSPKEGVPWALGEPPHLLYFVFRIIQLFLYLPEKNSSCDSLACVSCKRF